MTEMKFAEQYVDTIKSHSKTATVRYEDDRDLVPGDEIIATTPDGEPFARLRVEIIIVAHPRAAHSVLEDIPSARHGAGSQEDLIAALNEHYDDDIDNRDVVTAYMFIYTGEP